jgi:RNA polymerase sigma-70 factor (ECF subfamily)
MSLLADRRREYEALLLPELALLHAVARRLLRNPSDADDLVQEASLRAYRFFDRFERGTNFRAWILRILKNLFINDWHRRQAEPVASLDDAEHALERHVALLVESPASSPALAFEQHALEGELEAAIRALPVDFRMVVILCLVEGLSYQETADALEIPIGTVMSRLHRARRVLQARLLGAAHEAGLLPAAAPGEP